MKKLMILLAVLLVAQLYFGFQMYRLERSLDQTGQALIDLADDYGCLLAAHLQCAGGDTLDWNLAHEAEIPYLMPGQSVEVEVRP